MIANARFCASGRFRHYGADFGQALRYTSLAMNHTRRSVFRYALWVWLLLLATLPLLAQEPLKTGLLSFSGNMPAVAERHALVRYDFDLASEKFFVAVPQNYRTGQAYGALIFLSPVDLAAAVPAGWERVLEDRKLIFIAPQNIGNNQDVNRRAGLALVAALKLRELARIDTNRVFVSGFSGGARIASFVAFVHPDVFRGVFAVCGVNFCRAVSRVKATRTDEYGRFTLDSGRCESARKKVRFVLVTGSRDFRYGNILDIYEGGFLPDGFQVKLLDVPGMEHSLCPARTLREGLEFLEAAASPASGM